MHVSPRPLYAVSLMPFAGSNRLRVSALSPYIWRNILIGRIFPDAPEYIFSRNVYLVPLSPVGWTSRNNECFVASCGPVVETLRADSDGVERLLIRLAIRLVIGVDRTYLAIFSVRAWCTSGYRFAMSIAASSIVTFSTGAWAFLRSSFLAANLPVTNRIARTAFVFVCRALTWFVARTTIFTLANVRNSVDV